jgi:hypothetical protein
LKVADEGQGQKRIEYCPNCRYVSTSGSKLHLAEDALHGGGGRSDTTPDCGSSRNQKPNWNGRIGGFYLPKCKRRSTLESLLYFFSGAPRP